ncbi:MAG: HAD family phosphatase [Patescibacteria group bacterium]
MANQESQKTIKAIIFDFGDVICFWDDETMSPKRAQSLNLPKDSIHDLFFEYLREGGDGKYHSALDFYDRAKPQTPISREVFEQLFTEWDSTSHIDEEMVRLIKKLKRTYKIGLLSNFTKGLEEYLIDRFHMHRLFDSIVSSYNLKMRKPILDVYHYSAKDLGVQPEECLFIDDIEKNVQAARQIGMQGIAFTNLEKLKEQLLGILGLKV